MKCPACQAEHDGVDPIEHDRRVTDLLQHNNALLERARKAEAQAAHTLARPMRSVLTAFQPALYAVGCMAMAVAIFIEDTPCQRLPLTDRAVITAAWPITFFLSSITNHIRPHTSICERIADWRAR